MISRLVLLILICGSWLTHAAARPTIFVFLSDDHGKLDSTPYGATDVRTPNMQRLADAGMTFTHAFVASPACAPSRAALLTGLMPARNGAENNHTYKRAEIVSLPEVLRKLGYETAALGKVAHGPADVKRHGFDVTDTRHDAAFVGKFLQERDSSKPLCLFIGTHEPHVPWPDLEGYDPAMVKLPPTFVDTPETREFRARYYTDVTKADTRLGEVLDLAKKHLDPANTLILYTSDHGGQWPFGKWNLYDAGTCVPLIAAWPGVIQPGTRSDAMIQWTDLLPTLIEACGGKVPGAIDGRSFLPTLRDEKTAHRDVIFTTHSGDGRMNVYPVRSIRTPDWKLIANLHPEFAHTTHIDKALAKDGGRYWLSWFERAKSDPAAVAIVRRYHERPAVELYDMRADPHEQRNLASDPAQAARVKELRARLEAWMKQQGDQQTVFNEPRLLTDPASTRPGENSGSDNAPAKNGKKKAR
ncbi:MAG: sulfatase [Rhodobacteraceae bacterium]|nr:sulfatase [Paracoccaceae bacterium]